MINFSHPAFLGALLLLPLVWWILRKFPPQPKRQFFAPFFLLKTLKSEPKSKSKTPIPLLIFRMLLFSLLAILLARPVYQSEDYNISRVSFGNSNKAILVIDDSFAGAANWKYIKPVLDETVLVAKEKGHELALITTCNVDSKSPILFVPASQMAEEIGRISPKACIPDRASVAKKINSQSENIDAKVIWFSDGVDYGYIPKFRASYGVYTPAKESLPLAITKVTIEVESVSIMISRPSSEAAKNFVVNGISESGALLFSENGIFESGGHSVSIEVKLPREVRSKLKRLEIAGANHAGAVWLFDTSIKQSAVGIIMPDQSSSQPLLEEGYYLKNASASFAVVENASASELIKKNIPLIVEGDSSAVTAEDRESLAAWVRKGGVYLRFAGARLEEQVMQSVRKDTQITDPLLPVTLRGESRYGGLVNWQKEQTLTQFAENSPLFGVKPGEANVKINRLLTFDPAMNSGFEVWASASDGTPVIVAARDGLGYKVQVLTTATPSWSDLALSGVFVDVLERLARLGTGVSGQPSDSTELELVQKMDGFGRLELASGSKEFVKFPRLIKPEEGDFYSPGYYKYGAGVVAHNLGTYLSTYQVIAQQGAKNYSGGQMAFDFTPSIVFILFLMLIADMVTVLIGSLYSKLVSSGMKRAALLGAVMIVLPHASMASDPGIKTALAYVKTGENSVDYKSKAGLESISRELEARTSATLSAPIGVDLSSDDISIYQFLYYPMIGTEKLTVEQVLKLRQFMRLGGLIVIDSADGSDLSSSPYDSANIAQFLPLLALGQLYQMDKDNALSKSFFLLSGLTGKYGEAAPWVEKPDETVNDGVSPVIIGSNGWAEAWAKDEDGNYLYPIANDSPRTREMAMRSGINMVVYSLSGNYKSDQLHLEAITRRLK